MPGLLNLGIAAFGFGSLAQTGENALPASQQFASQYQQTLQFPSDLFDNKNFYMSFRFVKYQKRSISDPQPILINGGVIRLPLPRGLRDQSAVNYNNQHLNAAIGAGAEAIAGGIANGNISTRDISTFSQRILDSVKSGASPSQSAANFGSATKDLLQQTASTVGGVIKAGVTGDAAQGLAASPIGQALSAYTGLAVNPFLTVLFDSPTFKPHSFEWLFTPKSAEESINLRSIIQTFKYHMLPGFGENTNNILFNYPDMVLINITPDEYMYQFKPAVIRSFTVDYAASDAPAFFKNTNAPVAVRISMELQEIELWTKNDFVTPTSTTTSPIAAFNNTPIESAPSSSIGAG